MGIRFLCPNGHKLNVKAFLAGERGICPQCDAKFLVPSESGGQVEALREDADPAKSNSESDSESAAPVPQVVTQPVAAEAAPAAVEPPPPPAPREAAAPPPPVEAPSEVWYVRTADGQQYGPAQQEMMQSWVAEGRVTVDCWVWKTGWPDWKSGGQAITLLNVPPPDSEPSPVPVATMEAEVAAEATPDVEATIADPAPDALPESSNPNTMYQTTRRLRQERARKITLMLGVIVVVLFAVLVVVLMNNS